ncbi:MAG: protein kinase [Gammaproteobacteria bacterium]|nr:protein kinase [Gammaproteobacteria bacterium]
MGDGPAGIKWLTRYRDAPGFPPTILVANGDDYLAVAAIKAGAVDYLRREHAHGERLRALLGALTPRAAANPEATLPLKDYLRHARDRNRHFGLPPMDSSDHRFVRLIGQGGFSRVYLAERLHDGAAVVLKVIDTQHLDEPVIIQRFVREAELIAAIDNPYVVKVYDQGFTSDYGYIAMEFFQHGDLKQRLEAGLTVAAAVAYMRGIAHGLQAIHACDVIHRDLKPGNIMFRADDSLALADFGISKRLHDTHDLTVASGVVGTPSYLSPEQAMGAPVDARTDLYSAGVIFYELLAGRKPFRADSAAALVYQHLHTPPPRLPPELAAVQPIVDILLAKKPDERFDSADEFLLSLDTWLPANYGSNLRVAA